MILIPAVPTKGTGAEIGERKTPQSFLGRFLSMDEKEIFTCSYQKG